MSLISMRPAAPLPVSRLPRTTCLPLLLTTLMLPKPSITFRPAGVLPPLPLALGFSVLMIWPYSLM